MAPEPGAAGATQAESMPLPLEAAAGPAPSRRPAIRLGLFWRTFLLLAVLLLVSILAWLQTLRMFELEPRAVQLAQQIASLVNLSRAALVHSDGIARVSLIKTMSVQEGVRIVPREPDDRFELLDEDTLARRMSLELALRLGPQTVVARRVNGEPGLWVGFQIEGDGYWLLTDRSRLNPRVGTTWVIWLVVATALSLAGAALLASLISRPLKALAQAAARVHAGELEGAALEENAGAAEIRAVNREFNRMTRGLAQVERDRAVMLAGISHDLRTPLARLRLEAELSVADAQAREAMAADIDQADAIIDKFLDYARPDQIRLSPVALAAVLDRQRQAVQERAALTLRIDVPDDLRVLADETELARVFSNLLENALRYGADPSSAQVVVDVRARAQGDWVLLELRDHGRGVPPEQLAQLTQAFFRGDPARTAATGAGLGLAIVEKNVQRMGGMLRLDNHRQGGLAVRIQLRRA